MTADSLQKQSQGRAGRLFEKGQSGNPGGGRPGWHNRATLAAEVLLESEAEALTQKAIELAIAGDTTALRLCLERIVPQRRSRAVAFELPRIDRVEDLAEVVGSILQEVACGRLLLDEGATLVGMMESKRRVMGIGGERGREGGFCSRRDLAIRGGGQRLAVARLEIGGHGRALCLQRCDRLAVGPRAWLVRGSRRYGFALRPDARPLPRVREKRSLTVHV